MSQTFSDTVQMRAGATPQTFDGSQTLRLNERAKKIVAMKVSHSHSTITTDEGYAMAIRLQSSNWNGNRHFFAGAMANAGPTTNHAAYTQVLDIVALDIDVAPNTTVLVDISTIAGAVQTGTHDITVEFLYADGAIASDVKAAIEACAGHPSAKGGTYAYNTAIVDTAETPATGNAGANFNIPEEAEEIIAVCALALLDTAVTAAQELTGFYRVDYGLSNQGDQKYAINGLSPGLGTEVEGAAPAKITRSPIQVPTARPKRELQTRAFANSYGDITGGADWAINLLWR